MRTLIHALLLSAASLSATAGELVATARLPNPAGVFEELYQLVGDPLSGEPVTVVPGPGVSLPARQLGPEDSRRVTILHFNDLHNYLTEAHGSRGPTHRFSQMVQHAHGIRATAGDDELVLFLSAGDDHTGGVLDELLGFTLDSFVVDPAYHAYTVAGVDATVLGNHEFDRGTALLARWIDTHPLLPIVSANVHGSPHITPGKHYAPALLGVAKGLRIAILGLTTAEDTRVGTAENPGLAIASPLATVEAMLPALTEVSDMVILLTHLGYGAGTDTSGKAGAERRIGEGDTAVAQRAAALTDHPVVLVGGHTHTVLNAEGLEERNLIDGIPVLQAGGHGSHLGEFSLTVSLDGNASHINDLQARLIPIKRADQRVAEDDPTFSQVEQPADYDQDFERLVMQPLMDRLAQKLTETIAQLDVGTEMGTEATVRDRYVGETAIANFMNDALVARSETFSEGPVDIAAFNASGLVAGVPESGALSFEQWFQVMPFTDTIQVFELSGAQIGEILASNAQRIVRPEELEAGTVDLSGYVSRGFLHFSAGLRYTIVLNDSASEATVTDVTLLGEPLEAVQDKTFRVAFGSYIGNGGFSEAWNGQTISAGVPGDIVGYDLTALAKRDTGFVYRNEIINHIRELGTVSGVDGAIKDGRLTVVE